MTYNITRSDGTPLVSIPDNTLDTSSTSLTLMGKNALNFGQSYDQNLISLLQRFSGSNITSPLTGQIRYSASTTGIDVYDGMRWNAHIPPFDGRSGAVVVNTANANVSIHVTLQGGAIVSVVSYSVIPKSYMTDYIQINGAQYNFSLLFPDGIYPGINIPVTPLGSDDIYNPAGNNIDTQGRFVGPATSTNAFSRSSNINLVGSLSGGAGFDGSSNVDIPVVVANVYVGNTDATVAGRHTRVTVSDGGQIIGVGNLQVSDIDAALGYATVDTASISVTKLSNTIAARDANGNFNANVMTGTAASAFAFSPPVMLGINGDVLGAVSFDGLDDVTISSNLATFNDLESGTYNTVNVDNKGRITAAVMVDNVPIGSLVLIGIDNPIPSGWVICDGSTVPISGGGYITTPALSNLIIGSSTAAAGVVVHSTATVGNTTVGSNVSVTSTGTNASPGGYIYIMRVS